MVTGLGALGFGTLVPGCTVAPGPGAPRTPSAPWRLGGEGIVIERGDAEYESWRRAMPWQRRVAPRTPDCIVRPADRAQLLEALAQARRQRRSVAVRSGGHNVSEAFLRDDGMLLDLDAFRGVRVDAASATARVEPALWSRDLMLELAAAGLAFPVAHCATVPMGGYLLGGGIGQNTDEWGIGCHSVLEAEIALADGRIVTASADSHPELLWAVRGAGTGFFGVVLSYRLQCRPLPRAIHESVYVFPLARAGEVTAWMESLVHGGLERTEVMLLLAHNPRAPAGATAMERKVCIARVVQFCDSAAECAEGLRPVARSPLAQEAVLRLELQPTTIDRMMVDSVNAAAGLGFGRYHVNTIWTGRVAETVEGVAELFSRAPSPKSHFVVSLRRHVALREDCCFSSIDRGFVGCYGLWDEAADDAANVSWTQQASTLMQDFASGGYINEMDTFDEPARIRRAFSTAALERLQALRRRYDPEGLFHDFPGLRA